MCSEETATRILQLVKRLPEEDARRVLRLVESLSHPAPEETPLADFILTLPTVSVFREAPADIQEALRREWD